MNIIFYIHVLILLGGIFIPFVGAKEMLELYSLIIPFVFYHWLMNDDTCFLTQVEVWVTNEEKDKTFMGRIMGPVYNVGDDDAGKILKTVFFFLWFFVQYRLGRIHDLINLKGMSMK